MEVLLSWKARSIARRNGRERNGGEFAKSRGAINKINGRGGPSMGAFKPRLDSIFAPLFPLEKIRGSGGMATRSPNIVSLAKIRSNDFRANKQANGSCFGFIYPRGLLKKKKKEVTKGRNTQGWKTLFHSFLMKKLNIFVRSPYLEFSNKNEI